MLADFSHCYIACFPFCPCVSSGLANSAFTMLTQVFHACTNIYQCAYVHLCICTPALCVQSHRGSSQALPAQGSGDHRTSADVPSDTAHAAASTADIATASRDSELQSAAGSQQATDAGTQHQAETTEQEDSQPRASQDTSQAAPSLAKDSARQFADESAGSAKQSSNGRTAHFASLAEQADIRQARHHQQASL